jgi:hypothetical protein
MTFREEQTQALSSDDPKVIRAFCQKYEVLVPDDDELFWAAIHKARIMLGIRVRESSKWLSDRGYYPGIRKYNVF